MKRNYKLLFTAVFFIYIGVYAQQVNILIRNSPQKGALLALEDEKTIFVDSVVTINGKFTFSLKDKHPGIYRLQIDNRHFINFVNDEKHIEIKTDFNRITDSLKVISSESNKLYYKFVKLNKSYKTKTELLNVILQRYPKDDNYYRITLDKFKKLQNNYSTFVKVTSQKKPQTFISRYIRSSQLPLVNGALPYEEQLKYLKSHALDNVNFNDNELIYSDCFANKSIEYLMYFSNPKLPKSSLIKEFEKAVDTLLIKAKVNALVYKHVAEYLINGFKKFGFDSIVDYVVDNYVIKDDLQLDEKLEHSLQNRIDQAQKLKIGSKAPNIILPDTSGNEIDLSKIKANKTLILFYASWCPHCKKNLPELVKLYNGQKKKEIEILAISIDKKRKDWKDFIKKNNMNWVNVSDLKGWNGKSARDYYIYATPTMFLIDRNMRIISKPLSIEDLRAIFQVSGSPE